MTDHFPHLTYANEVLDALANAQLWPDSHGVITTDSCGTHLDIHLAWHHGDAVTQHYYGTFEVAWHSGAGWRAFSPSSNEPNPLPIPTVASPQAVVACVRALVDGGPDARLPDSGERWHDAARLEAIEDANWIPATH
ncbi:hypothetical protein ACFXEF_18740 [Brevibacterium sediminis]|uniref:hypothetical protein n=1 Tax=Brevibacterium sediminis TaxID=1857024 RepID=UPI00366C535C